MDERAKRLIGADEADDLYQSAKAANSGASRIVSLRKIHASNTLGADSDVVRHYEAELAMLKEQSERIQDLDPKAMEEAAATSLAIVKKYGNKRIRDIRAEDHNLLRSNGPR